jgi:hypothetical protein
MRAVQILKYSIWVGLIFKLTYYSQSKQALPQAAPLTPVPEVFKCWIEQQLQDDRSMAVHFVMERTLPTLTEKVRTEGILWKFPGGDFCCELGLKEKTLLISDAGVVWLRRANVLSWEMLPEDDIRYRAMTQFFSTKNNTIDSLQKNFNIKEFSVNGTIHSFYFFPRTLVIKKYIKEIQMMIDVEAKNLKAFSIQQQDGAVTRVDFEKIKIIELAEKNKRLDRNIK